MTYRAQCIGKTYIVRWEKPESKDLDEIRVTLAHLRSIQDQPLVYVSIAGKESQIPDDGTRKRMTGTMNDFLDSCSSAHLVVEGKGLKFATIRSVAAGFLMLQRSQHVYVNDSLRTALVDAGLGDGDVDVVVREAESIGLAE